jgi:raffinose/stachyose/melibiose transport system permease protein
VTGRAVTVGRGLGANPGSRRTALLFILPAALLLLAVFAGPLLQTAYFSLTDWRGGVRPANFIGLVNYERALTSPRVLEAISHNAILLLVIPIEIALAVLVASVLRERIHGWRLYRFLVFVPSMISITIAGYAWTYFLGPQGIFNTILRLVGGEEIARPWLADPAFALPAIMLLLVWRDTGFAVILFYSRLLAVDDAIYEAAALDRARRWHRLIYIDLPLLKTTISLFAVLMSVWIFSFVFNYVYVMTGGGPGTASTVAELEIFREGFSQSRPGYASAISIILLAITLPLIILQVRLQVRRRRG